MAFLFFCAIGDIGQRWERTPGRREGNKKEPLPKQSRLNGVRRTDGRGPYPRPEKNHSTLGSKKWFVRDLEERKQTYPRERKAQAEALVWSNFFVEIGIGRPDLFFLFLLQTSHFFPIFLTMGPTFFFRTAYVRASVFSIMKTSFFMLIGDRIRNPLDQKKKGVNFLPVRNLNEKTPLSMAVFRLSKRIFTILI